MYTDIESFSSIYACKNKTGNGAPAKVSGGGKKASLFKKAAILLKDVSVYCKIHCKFAQNANKRKKYMSKRILIDCSSGISGDMFISALAGLGVNFETLQGIFKQAGLEISIKTSPVNRMAGPGLRTDITWPGGQPLRHLPDLTDIINRLQLPLKIREKACAMLARLASAEAAVHGVPLEEVHFHEVGAIDTLVDVLGAVWGLAQLEADEVVSTPVPWFGGFVDCSHGRMALPAPATAKLLEGKPTVATTALEELVTPTGALLLDTLATSFAPADAGTVAVFERSGLGYGSREPSAQSDWAGRGLRLHLFARPGRNMQYNYIMDEVAQLSCHIDHLTGEEIGYAVQMLDKAGALDVLWLTGLTKKNRPAGELRVLCKPEQMPQIQAEMFRHTHSLGIRISRLGRVTLPRRETQINSPWGPLEAKEYELLDQTFTKAEYEALVKTAARLGIGLPAMRVEEK